MSKFSSCIILLLTFVLTLPSVKAETFTEGRWSYACMHDHKDPYGSILNPANCWAMICGETVKGDHGENCVLIFKFTRKHIGLGHLEEREACDYYPGRIAVDGRRIDQLSNKEKIRIVLKGKTITREENYRPWPYCSYSNVTTNLDGAASVLKKLMGMKDGFLK